MTEIIDLQIPAQKYLQLHGIKYIHLQQTRSRKYDTNKTLKGLPDLICFINKGKVLIFEFKSKGGKLKPNQIEYRDYFYRNGYEYHVIYNLQDFIEIIKKNI